MRVFMVHLLWKAFDLQRSRSNVKVPNRRQEAGREEEGRAMYQYEFLREIKVSFMLYLLIVLKTGTYMYLTTLLDPSSCTLSK
jgi:hypothetical protein